MSLCKLFFPKHEKEPESHPGSINDQITDSITQSSPITSKPNIFHGIKDTDYIEPEFYPHYPEGETPSREDCAGYKYMSMNQLCNIAEKHGFVRSKVCNAFGGDKGKYAVPPERKARHFKKDKNRIEKFVLIDAVEQYFMEIGLDWK